MPQERLGQALEYAASGNRISVTFPYEAILGVNSGCRWTSRDPFSGQVFVFRGRRGHLIKLLFWDGQGMVLYAKRLDRGHFVWPATAEGAVSLTPAQLSMLKEGIDWRAPVQTWQP